MKLQRLMEYGVFAEILTFFGGVVLSQEDLFPPSEDNRLLLQNKVTLLYLINKMDIPISNSQITQFAQSQELMNYYTAQKCLNELVESGYLEESSDNHMTRYMITDDGTLAMESFIKHISLNTKNLITKYVFENYKKIKQDFETTAYHFFDQDSNEYIVKCNAYEDEILLMELNMSVVSKEQALQACNNWKNNVASIYGKILNLLINEEEGKNDEA